MKTIRNLMAEAQRISETEPFDQAAWNAVRDTLIDRDTCPQCASNGERSTLAPWTPGSMEVYAGRTCYQCEEFFICGEQLEYATADYGYEGHSDADPGL